MSRAHHAALAAMLLSCAACRRDPPSRDDEPAGEQAGASPERETKRSARSTGRSAVRTARSIDDAPNDDADYSGTEPLEVVRLVYRLDFYVPAVFGERPSTMPLATAELHVDVSEDRLRARFAGPGWPVAAGSEVRLRRDRGGVYVFDATGGHPLGVGMLAAWFQGGPLPRNTSPSIAVRRAPPAEQAVPGDLLCALIAEWASQPRDEIERRCGEGGAPISFRVGPWRAERTAEVPVRLPRQAMRADEEDPPLLVPREETSRAFMEPTVLALVPASARRAPPSDAPPTDVGEGLRVVNAGPTRIIVLSSGVPVGWVDAAATGTFVGLRPGEHLVAAMRPLGNAALRPRSVTVPGQLTIGRRRAP